MDSVQHFILETTGLEGAALERVLSARRPATRRAYAHRFQSFLSWCAASARDASSPSDLDIIHFLSTLTHLRSSSLRLYVSSIVCFLQLSQPSYADLASRPLIRDYLGGAQNLEQRPPPVSSAWDIGVAFEHCRSISNDAPLVAFSQKTIFLLACASGWRPRSDLGRLLLSHLSFIGSEGTRIPWYRLSSNFTPHAVCLYSWRPKEGTSKATIVHAFADPQICPVHCLHLYILRTFSLRASPPNELALVFISSRPPYADCKEDTLGSWVQSILTACGFDATAHSTRSTSASSAFFHGTDLHSILRAANWTSARPFYCHYMRPNVAPSINAIGLAMDQQFSTGSTNTL